MGQQQLLMIVLALIIIAIAVSISISLFRSNAIEHKRDLLIEETQVLGTMALQYFKKPQEMGGGGQSFVGWSIPSQMNQTANGSFVIASMAFNQVVITGTGSEVVTGTDSIKVQTTVTPLNMFTTIIN
jgi:hypothetical protein